MAIHGPDRSEAYLQGVNERQRNRRRERRNRHCAVAGQVSSTSQRDSYPAVKQGHIVPRCYQQTFAVNGQVAVHIDDAREPVLMNTRNAGTRSKYYRRTCRDGTFIDDFEAALGTVEGVACPVLREVAAGAPVNRERKQVLCQLLGMQMVRGPAFFEKRAKDVEQAVLDDLTPERLRPGVLDEAGDDFAAVRRQIIELFQHPTEQLSGMAAVGLKVAAVLGSMRWQLLQFPRSLLVYSDQPVVVWPLAFDEVLLPMQPQFGPINAVEVVVPLPLPSPCS